MSKVQRFFTNQAGAAAVEFALVSFMVIMTIVFVMFVGLAMYMNLELDNATNRAARQVMIGTIQTQNVSQSDFRTKYVCPYLPTVMACADVVVSLQSVTKGAAPNGYYAFVNSTTTGLKAPGATPAFSAGGQGSFEYLQVTYPFTLLPSFMATLLSNGTYKGSPAFFMTSTAAFKNEQY